MTTYTFGGLRVTSTSGTPSAITSSSMTMVTSDIFFFRYTMDDPAAGEFSTITVDPQFGKIHRTEIGGVRFDLTGTASVAEWSWTDSEGDAKKTMMLRIDGLETNVSHYFVMAGAALPTFANAAAFDTFLDDLDAQTSIITGTTNPVRPGTNITMSRFTQIIDETEDDGLIGEDGIDDWSEDELKTGDGDDVVEGVSLADLVDGGDGNDSIGGNNGNDSLIGADGNDAVFGDAGNDTVSGGNNNDSVFGGSDNDLVKGGKGIDTLDGGNGDDRLEGETGNDSLSGGNNNDVVSGGIGNDTVFGGNGDDSVSGGRGNDIVEGDDGADTLNGGDGADSMAGDAGDDLILALNGDDLILAGDDDDRVEGGNGNDTIDGGTGDDLLRGNGGNDVIGSGSEDDTMSGGAGADVFVYLTGDDIDTIVDFDIDADLLRFDSLIGETFEDIIAFASQDGSKVLFDFGEGATLTLERVQLDALTAEHFDFI